MSNRFLMEKILTKSVDWMIGKGKGRNIPYTLIFCTVLCESNTFSSIVDRQIESEGRRFLFAYAYCPAVSQPKCSMYGGSTTSSKQPRPSSDNTMFTKPEPPDQPTPSIPPAREDLYSTLVRKSAKLPSPSPPTLSFLKGLHGQWPRYPVTLLQQAPSDSSYGLRIS